MANVDDRTSNRNYPLPHEENFLSFDVDRLRSALSSIDEDVQTALDGVSDLEQAVGQPEGLATLDEGGKVPATQLPSFVDDVLEFDDYEDLPATGEKGKIYVLLEPYETPEGSISQFRWSGSAYIPIVSSPGSTDNLAEGTSNLYHTAARVRDVLLTGLSLASSAVITATDSILSALGKLQAQVSGKQDALVSGTNIKSINGQSLLGSGNVTILTPGQPLPVVDLGEVGNSGSETVSVDLSAGDFFLLSMNNANTTGALTLNFTNIPDTAGKRLSWHVRIIRGGRKGNLLFGQTVNWVGGSQPQLGSTSNSWDLLMFYKIDSLPIRAMLVDAS